MIEQCRNEYRIQNNHDVENRGRCWFNILYCRITPCIFGFDHSITFPNIEFITENERIKRPCSSTTFLIFLFRTENPRFYLDISSFIPFSERKGYIRRLKNAQNLSTLSNQKRGFLFFPHLFGILIELCYRLSIPRIPNLRSHLSVKLSLVRNSNRQKRIFSIFLQKLSDGCFTNIFSLLRNIDPIQSVHQI